MPTKNMTFEIQVLHKFTWVVHPFLNERWATPGKVAKACIARLAKKEEQLGALKNYFRHKNTSTNERRNIMRRIAEAKKTLQELKREVRYYSKDRVGIFYGNIEVMFDRHWGKYKSSPLFIEHNPLLVVYCDSPPMAQAWVDIVIDFADEYKCVPDKLGP